MGSQPLLALTAFLGLISMTSCAGTRGATEDALAPETEPGAGGTPGTAPDVAGRSAEDTRGTGSPTDAGADSAPKCGPCTVPANATATCAGGSCDYVCNYGFQKSGSICESKGWMIEASGATSNLNAIWGSGAGDVYVGGANGTVLHSSGDGVWTAESTGVTGNIGSIWGTASDNLYACGADGLFRSRGKGTWVNESPAVTCPSYGTAIGGPSAADIWVAGYNKVWRSNGGGTWAQQTLPNSAGPLWTVLSLGATLYLGGVSIHVSKSGGALTDAQLGFTYSMWGSSDTNFYFHNADAITHMSNGVRTYDRSVIVSYLWGSSATDVYAVRFSMSARPLAFHSDGTTWTPEPVPASTTSLNRVWGSGAGDVYMVGDNGIIIHRRR